MCALFGPRVDVHAADLWLDVHVWPEPLGMWPGVHRAPLLAASLHVSRLAETRAEVRRFAWPALGVQSHTRQETLLAATAPPVALGLSVQRHPQPLPPFTTASRVVTGLELAGQAHDVAIAPRIRVRRDLAFMREKLVERRGVSARRLTEAQSAHWKKRMGDAKRVPVKLVDLVAVFPDVPIIGDQPVQYAQGALSYRLPDEQVPLTTVVIAKHLTTGALLVGRFARA